GGVEKEEGKRSGENKACRRRHLNRSILGKRPPSSPDGISDASLKRQPRRKSVLCVCMLSADTSHITPSFASE
ncbi:hypothetical protein B296_00054028, partial [Ensete ventricosum]